MLLRIDPRSSDPIFEQIAFQVKDALARGEIGEGTKLPSVRELARELAINPNTVVRAYESLERSGVIVRRKGAGCFVNGRGSELAASRKREQLADAMRRMVTEAYHLGCSAKEIRSALESALKRIDFEGGASSKE